jgi:hypothetical protein
VSTEALSFCSQSFNVRNLLINVVLILFGLLKLKVHAVLLSYS